MVAGLIGLAHRRLAVIDRDGGAQPMYSPDGRYALVYNGEVYNYRALRDSLTAAGRSFTTDSDTEVVLAAWEHWGEDAFDRFEGMFALAIADRESGRVVLARDHFGIKPLYLAKDDDGRVFFASEFKALFASGTVQRRPDDQTIYRYLQLRVHDDTERTFFAGVSRLMPGELASIESDGRIERRRYTRLYDDLAALSNAGAGKSYDDPARVRVATALRNAVRMRLVSDVPVGTALSGGLDSATIVTTINQLLAESDAETAQIGAEQQTFSAVFPGERNDEERYVDAVATRCGRALRVHKVRPNPDQFIEDLPDFIRTQEEPVISTGPYAQYRVMCRATQHVTVMIDGQGADEMLAGYLPYYLVRLRQLRQERGRLAAGMELGRSVDVLWRLVRFRLADRLRRRHPLPVSDLLDPAFLAAHSGQRLPVIRDNLKTRLLDDLFRHSLPSLLRYEDRNTMRFSVEGRVPFLDTTLLRTIWELDDTAIIDAGWNKRALRDATKDLLPPLINRRRNKIGFTTPEDSWFSRIKNDVYLVFASESFGRRAYFNQTAVLRAFSDFVAGKADAETMLFWRLLNVELWLREFIDHDPAVDDASASEPASPAAESPAESPTAASPTPSAALSPAAEEDEVGRHPQAPDKPDFVPNDGKSLVLAGTDWARFPLRVDLIGVGDPLTELATDRVSTFFEEVATAPQPARAKAVGSWYLFISEKVVAVSQGRVFHTSEIRPGVPARMLSRFVVRTPFGIGLGHPTTMQLAIMEAGLAKILLAAVVGFAGKLAGRGGLFYQVAGPAVRAIDGPTRYSAYPANVSAKLAPKDPDRVARQISAALRAGLPSEWTSGFGGTVIIDANDLGRDILGHDTGLPPQTLAGAFADNPLGQERQQTPFAVVFNGGAETRTTGNVGGL
jgi:asparagine synthase (glutamine-hydrolysing)